MGSSTVKNFRLSKLSQQNVLRTIKCLSTTNTMLLIPLNAGYKINI